MSKVGKITRFVLGTYIETVTGTDIAKYSKSMTKYVLETWKKERATGFVSKGILCVPLIATDVVSEETSSWLRNRSFDRYWLAFEFPAVFSMVDHRIYYSMKTPTWGRLYYAGFRKYVENTLASTKSH